MISAFDLFKIGIGPSSSHTVGPMRAAHLFTGGMKQAGQLSSVARLRVTLYGSLAWTGKGHATDKAVVLGLAGELPETVDPDHADTLVAEISTCGALKLEGRNIAFAPAEDIVFDRETAPPRHPNTLAFEAFNAVGALVAAERWCSVGGGFVTREDEPAALGAITTQVPYLFANAVDLLRISQETGLTIAEIVRANEVALRPAAEVLAHVDRVIATMMAAIDRGLQGEGVLPGALKVPRRARALRKRLEADTSRNDLAPHEKMDWVSLFAMAVNEENAAGGRVVTAPTNGAAGVIPAVLRYYSDMCPGASHEGMRNFIFTATAIGGLFKTNASISGAEVGCQGEVGVASSMAAAGLAAARGCTNAQVENAAEIAMEHHLGMTCDPVGGLVQIPCIERNAFGAIKAISAASLARRGDGSHIVSLDQVIATMRQTGADMNTKYKETSLGGLAANFIEC
ncbi:L-serine ammonia-lyase [Acidocella aminolytica]|jgi:L-serine dehydratase|uniref:L-serine dehydratase n=1 Tax=Acidocella aminolytica 101 = DSM 11237 TaxID=1120923 RepID=A0A0D6PIU2_9PROT|nr:L-serine ammonia-lyase [Acidocella aminolytica]GAN81670.1 L-serine deaminase/L-threonine deaminase [Acidocella aminolytica 101 = DSM 11237]GBQ40114.1 L-serine deaminase [Acidocella aminolytica 101 = DSM 11237]SHF19294.1 L-serine dehydratase [Acidocella aminolytica 101 = DSM 11237]